MGFRVMCARLFDEGVYCSKGQMGELLQIRVLTGLDMTKSMVKISTSQGLSSPRTSSRDWVD